MSENDVHDSGAMALSRYQTTCKRRRGVATAAITVFAGLIAWRWHEQVVRHFCCDMSSYIDMALDFARDGLFGSSNQLLSLRTYGYPFLVGLLSHASSRTPASVESVVFVFQLTFFFIAAWIFASILARALRCSRVGIYALIVLNPILLAATPAVLSDLVAALAASLALALVFHDRSHRTAVACASALLAGYAAMVRPASIALLAVVMMLWIVRGRWLRGLPVRSWPVVGAAMAIPFVPQLVNNWRLFHQVRPLVVRNLYELQTIWGMQYLKYATLADGQPVQYVNPWYDGSSATFFSWLALHPLSALGTAGVHVFALFDQDFAVTYIHDFHPWYRWPLCAASFAYLFIGVTTIAGVVAHSCRRRRIGRIGFVAIAILVAIMGYLLLYIPTAVESRFSQPVYVLLAPFVVLGWRSWWRLRRIGWAVLLVAFVVPCLMLSHWLAMQAPALR